MQFVNECEGLQAKAALNEATVVYQQMLFDDPRGERALDYLVNERQFSKSTLAKFKIGFAPHGWEFYHHLMGVLHEQNGAYLSTLEKAGLIKKGREATPENPRYYTPFQNRIIFPLMQGEQIIGFTARKLEDGRPENPKYLNTGETPLYHKGRFLYNGDAGLRAAKDKGFLFAVEGPTSILQAYQQGVNNMVASCGTSFTPDHLALINKRVPGLEVLFCFDADEAGLRAAERKCEEFLGHPIKVCVLPTGEDPDSFMRQGNSLLEYAANHREGAFDFLISRKSQEIDLKSPEGALVLIDRLKPTLRGIPDSHRGIYLDALSTRTGVSKESIDKILYPQQRSQLGAEAEHTSSSPVSQIMYVAPPRAGWERRFIKQLISSGPDRKVMRYLDKVVQLNPNDFGLVEAKVAYQYLLAQSRGDAQELLGLAGTAMFGYQGLLEYAGAQNIFLNQPIARELFSALPRRKTNNGKKGNGGRKNTEEAVSTLEQLEESLLMVLSHALPQRIREAHRAGANFTDLYEYLKQVPSHNGQTTI
ncbi:MAG: toprim domain-containing protein [Nanoarchaeota archaeon]|nr:toprim domain-containing protein [Nanoarchaeota archaeon]